MILERSIQLVACGFVVSTDDRSFVDRLDRLTPSAVQDHPVTQWHSFQALGGSERWRVIEDGRAPEVFPDVDHAVDFVDRRLHELALDALADRTKLHAGCATWHGRRFLVVGDRGAGKTTLMTRLLFEDCRVEGDEMVVLHDGVAVAYPRRFGIRRRTLRLVPQVGALAPHLLEGPEADRPGGFHVIAFDPAQLDLEWRITRGPVEVILCLTPRHGGRTRVQSCPTELALQRVLAQSAPPSTGSGAWVRDVGSLVGHAAAYEITIGDLDSAVASVRECVTDNRFWRGSEHGDR
jgi:hypothetical protein